MSDLAAIEALVDAIDRVDDHVRGVLGLADGRLGDDAPDGRSWLARQLGGAGRWFGFGEKHVARGLGAAYGPDQLRKAARETDDVLSAVTRLRRSNDQRVFDLLARLDRLALGHLGHELSEVTPESPELTEIHRRLGDARAAALETTTRLLLDR